MHTKQNSKFSRILIIFNMYFATDRGPLIFSFELNEEKLNYIDRQFE